MGDQRHPLYRLAQKAHANRHPVPTMCEGMHRLDLRTDEFDELRKLIPDFFNERGVDVGKLVERLKHAVATASNDDESKPGTEKRARQVDRIDTMLAAIEVLEAKQ